MSWEHKLRIVIEAVQQGQFADRWIGFHNNPPISEAEIAESRINSPIDLPEQLRTLYTITDGLYIGIFFRIGSLKHEDAETLDKLNISLSGLRELCQSDSISLVIGSEAATGDFLCLTENGTVVSIMSDAPEEANFIAQSLDEFLDETCLGEAYIQYIHDYKLERNEWTEVLYTLGFIN